MCMPRGRVEGGSYTAPLIPTLGTIWRLVVSFTTRQFYHRQTACGTLLTPWSTVRLEKLTGSQLVKKFPACYGTRRFITAFTSARHLSLSWASSILYIPPNPASTLQLSWLRFFRAFSSVVRQMPGQNPQSWGTARSLLKFLCCSMYCLFCVVLCTVCV
jgi:hypothetical protein